MRINERGFETIGVAGIGNESLYRAVSHGLMGDEDYDSKFRWNDVGDDGLGYFWSEAEMSQWCELPAQKRQCSTPDAEIEFTAYVLCVPTISNVTKAYALEAALPILTPQPTKNNAPEEVLKQNRIMAAT
ncbi:hypothetical protein Tco_0619512 [Tanacetum coccineum]